VRNARRRKFTLLFLSFYFLFVFFFFLLIKSHRLELLSSRLRKSGFPDVRFFVISPFSDSRENERSENDLEIEVWQEIGAKYEIENFVDDVRRGNRSEIIILQDDPQSRMWERFRASREQAIIIDR